MNQRALNELAGEVIDRLLSGQRVIVSDECCDAMAAHHNWELIRMDFATCRNRGRLGVRDAYVAWVGDANRPADLEFKTDPRTGEHYAIGSAVDPKKYAPDNE